MLQFFKSENEVPSSSSENMQDGLDEGGGRVPYLFRNDDDDDGNDGDCI